MADDTSKRGTLHFRTIMTVGVGDDNGATVYGVRGADGSHVVRVYQQGLGCSCDRARLGCDHVRAVKAARVLGILASNAVRRRDPDQLKRDTDLLYGSGDMDTSNVQ